MIDIMVDLKHNTWSLAAVGDRLKSKKLMKPTFLYSEHRLPLAVTVDEAFPGRQEVWPDASYPKDLYGSQDKLLQPQADNTGDIWCCELLSAKVSCVRKGKS